MSMFMITTFMMSVVLDSDDQGKNAYDCPNKCEGWVMHDLVNQTLVMVFFDRVSNQQHGLNELNNMEHSMKNIQDTY